MAAPIKRNFSFEISGKSLRVVGFTAKEAISTPYEVEIQVAHKEEVKFDDVVGKEALLVIPGVDSERYFHGMVNQFIQIGASDNIFHYRATIVPMLWLLSIEKDLRIFQNMNVQEIVTQILKDSGMTTDDFEFRLQNSYEKWEYCVQYRESGLNFISRLLEEKGIFYFFEHKENKQKKIQHFLVFGDSKVNYQPIAGGDGSSGKTGVKFHPLDTRAHAEDTVQEISLCRKIRPGKVILNDYNFKKPSLNLTVEEAAKTYQKIEVYDYPGEYSEDKVGKELAKVRLEEARAFLDRAEGKSDSPNFMPGFTYKLIEHEIDSFNQEYFITEVTHIGSQEHQDGVESTLSQFNYGNRFVCIPSTMTMRPKRKTAKPRVKGIQSAIVVGPSGEEIYTDEHGRVKVQFHWDRLGKRDEKSSCWIRVSQAWAGTGWGAMFIPRIGQEVIVDFEEGDPDRPLITGSVYHGTNTPPYPLPDDKTKSTIKSSSSTGGSGFNEIRFEDKSGKEEFYIHAQKDMNLAVENDRSESIGNDRHLTVGRDKLENVGRDTHIIISRDELSEIGRDHNLKIGGKEAVEIAESRSITVNGDVIEVFKKNHSEEVSKDYYVKAKNVVIEALTGLSIKVGGNFITIDSAGVTIKGAKVNINSGGSALSGSAGSPVAPAAPLKAAVSGTSAAGKVSAAGAPPSKKEEPMSPIVAVAHNAPTHKESDDEDKDKPWVEIEVVDEDDKPVTGEKYIITLPDGKTVATGTTDSTGKARVSGIDPNSGGACKVTFPNMDKDAWEKL